jgi:DNA modification methylase
MPVLDQKITNKFAVYQGDCCELLPDIPSDSIGHSIFSPPFCDLYSYSDSERDMGNSKTYEEFFNHFAWLIEELERVMIPGRVVAVHCMDLPLYKRDVGFTAMRDFPGDIIRAFQKAGFLYHCRICIWKDPLIAATRTKAIGLMHKQLCKDSTIVRTGIADSMVCFRKRGENPLPVANEQGLTEYYGSTPIPHDLDRFMDHDDPRTNKRSHWIWQQYASPVWMDIRQGRVLPFREAKDGDDIKHICPLQLDVIERCIALWSSKGDTVLTPFMGVGSEVYTAVRNGRRGVGVELKKSYYRQALMNLRSLMQTGGGITEEDLPE